MAIITTYSSWSMFQACPRKYQYRYIDCLVPKGRDDNLYFGGLIHECLDKWHSRNSLRGVLNIISESCAERTDNLYIKQMYHIARAMMLAYTEKYGHPHVWDKRFSTRQTEKQFENGRIVNPNTRHCSKRFRL